MSTKNCSYQEHTLKPFSDFKRLFDIASSLFLILISFPFFLSIACLIKLTSKGSVFYGGYRLGKNGELFCCWKFRTMYPDAEKKLEGYLDKSKELRNEWNQYLKLKKDPRVTWIGRGLRKMSLDELPQLWNVLKGDLSLVGPRPYLVEEVQSILGARAHKILSVRPGITGLWQVSGRNNIPFSDRIRLDEEYVMKRSFYLDLVLLCKTIPTVIFAKGY